jgi:hypothetical protein
MSDTGRAVLPIIALQAGPLFERAWLRQLLAGRPSDWHRHVDPVPVVPGALYVRMGLDGAMPKRDWLDAVAAVPGCGLLDLGDEHYRVDPRLYAHFSYVIRVFAYPPASGTGVHVIPLGPSPGLGDRGTQPAGARRYLWAFSGVAKGDRMHMVRALSRAPRGFVSMPAAGVADPIVPRDTYLDAMRDAAFAPCPAGNSTLETLRPYEALELGTIPIIPRRRGYDAYRELFGVHPLPCVETWSQAARLMTRFEADRAGLDALQDECLSWWDTTCVRLQDELSAFIDAGRAGAYRNVLKAHFATRRAGPLDRLGHIMRQMDVHQWVYRAGAAARRIGLALQGRTPPRTGWTLLPYLTTDDESPSGRG